MGKNSSKIDQDTAKNSKTKNFEKQQFLFKSCVFLNEISRKLLFFKISRFTVFAVSWSIFELFLPILPFWNSQSLIFKMAQSMFDLST